MARIKGVDIPNDKRIEISLTYIYGIGRNLSKTILNNAKVDLNKKAKDLTGDELSRIRTEVEKYTVEGDLRREVNLNIKTKMEIQLVGHQAELSDIRVQRRKLHMLLV